MATKEGSDVPALAAMGLDIGKDVFHLVGLSADGTIAFRRKIRRLALTDTFKTLPRCLVGMEACLSAHFVSRILRALGHEPRIIPAIYVKPFVKGQKNAIRISITNGKGHVVLADQVHEEASSCRVELTFPLAAEPEAGFADREEQIIRDARAVLAAAVVAFERR